MFGEYPPIGLYHKSFYNGSLFRDVETSVFVKAGKR